MKNILKIGIATLASAALLSGCIKESFPTSVASNEQVNSNPAALESMVNGMAAFVNKLDVLGGENHYDWGYPSIMMIRDLMCEDMSTVSSGYEHFSDWIKNQYQGEDYIFPQYLWNFYTQFLQTANAVIGAVDESSASQTQKYYLAMAYCYRALINLDMGRMYEFKRNNYTTAPELEGLTIPLIKENMTEEEARNNPRVPKEALLEFIMGDLAKAIDFFGGNSEDGTTFSRSSKSQPDLSVAYGLQARAYMWAEDYTNAKIAAQNALKAGKYTPLNESQWTDTTNGFNNATSQSSWMWASILAKEDDVVKTSILNWASWMCSETSFGYAFAGPFRLADVNFYSQIPDADWRKKSWVAPAGSAIEVPMVASTSSYDNTKLPEYACVKFRPGDGAPDDYNVGAVVDIPLMRCEEMYFIIAECDAHNGSSASLVDFMRSYRYPSYTCNASSTDAIVDECILQKRIEFWGEGIILFDYKRLNKSITRAYEGTNHIEGSRFNTNGLAPWMNFCIVRSEHDANLACVSNPDPSDLVEDIGE